MGFPAWTRSIRQISANLVATVVIRNPLNNTRVINIRDSADTADIFFISNTGAVSASSITGSTNSTNAITAPGVSGGIRFGPTTGQTFIQRIAATYLVTDAYWGVRVLPTASRVPANNVQAGAMYYDSTLSKPVWSDGVNWRDATGAIV